MKNKILSLMIFFRTYIKQKIKIKLKNIIIKLDIKKINHL